MKAKSGIVLVREGGLDEGSVIVSFDQFLEEEEGTLRGENEGRAVLRYAREIGGSGRFSTPPAYMASIHEYKLEDSRVGDERAEIDDIMLDPVASEHEFRISWQFSDSLARAVEIGFLAIGE
jgi:hypothetical protein